MQAASAISPVASYSSSRPTILLVAAALVQGCSMQDMRCFSISPLSEWGQASPMSC